MLRYIGHWHSIGYGYWLVETIEGSYVGEVGFGDYRRDIIPTLDGLPEMGWVLATSAHGRGFAFEAASAALTWRDSAMPPSETVCIIAPGHAVSFRIAEKLGFEQSNEALYQGHTRVVLRRANQRA